MLCGWTSFGQIIGEIKRMAGEIGQLPVMQRVVRMRAQINQWQRKTACSQWRVSIGQCWGKPGHNRIVSNVHGEFRNHLRMNPCKLPVLEKLVKVEGSYFYPDVIVDCSDHDDWARFIETSAMALEVFLKPENYWC